MENKNQELKSSEELLNEIKKLHSIINQKDLAIEMLKLNIKIISEEK